MSYTKPVLRNLLTCGPLKWNKKNRIYIISCNRNILYDHFNHLGTLWKILARLINIKIIISCNLILSSFHIFTTFVSYYIHFNDLFHFTVVCLKWFDFVIVIKLPSLLRLYIIKVTFIVLASYSILNSTSCQLINWGDRDRIPYNNGSGPDSNQNHSGVSHTEAVGCRV